MTPFYIIVNSGDLVNRKAISILTIVKIHIRIRNDIQVCIYRCTDERTCTLISTGIQGKQRNIYTCGCVRERTQACTFVHLCISIYIYMYIFSVFIRFNFVYLHPRKKRFYYEDDIIEFALSLAPSRIFSGSCKINTREGIYINSLYER